jgi:hypothetical protein
MTKYEFDILEVLIALFVAIFAFIVIEAVYG